MGKLNIRLSWLKGSSHFKSLNLNSWLAILSVYSDLPLVSPNEIKFTSVMQFYSLKIIHEQSEISRPFLYV